MGCDIHLHQEIKVKGKWLHYSHPNVNRDYRLFALLGNVRNYDECPFLSDERGLPADITDMTRLAAEYCKEDWHSHSYIERSEILRLEGLYNKCTPRRDEAFNLEDVFGYLFGNGWDYDPPDMGLEDVRWIFWFDN